MFTFEKYQEAALRSIKPHDSKELATADWALGIGGEAAEVTELYLNAVNNKMTKAKEIGDVIWYATALAKELELEIKGFSEGEEREEPPAILSVMLLVTAGRIQEAVKHFMFHKEKTSKEHIQAELDVLLLQVANLCASEYMSINDCAELNAGKLAHRFNLKNGGQYNKTASENRHSRETEFSETATYKRLVGRITGIEIAIDPEDTEVL